MKAVVDSVGRVVVPKPLRDALGLQPGSEVEISRYGAGLQLIPAGRTAQVVLEGGVPVVAGDTKIDDEIVFALLDAGRRWASLWQSIPASPCRYWYRPMQPTRSWSAGGLAERSP